MLSVKGVALNENQKNTAIVVLVAIVFILCGILWYTYHNNNDDAGIQRLNASAARIENILGDFDTRLKRIEQTAIAGEAGTARVISGIGKTISLVEASEGRQLSITRNNQAAAERASHVEDILRKVYQREQEKAR